MKFMISQPMNGLTTEQIKQNREEVVKKLEKEGHTVIDTVFEDFNDSSIKNKSVFFLGKSLEKMAEADAIYFMDGWRNARGCVVEHTVASLYQIPIVEE